MRLRRLTTTNATAPLVLACAAVLAIAVSGCGGGSSGKELFTSAGCSGCHTLADAGATGQGGPNLDISKPMAAQVAAQVTQGGGGMPSFAGQLSSDQIKAVADYVEKATHQ
jgi:mono/diheme cytochrome c family protein